MGPDSGLLRFEFKIPKIFGGIRNPSNLPPPHKIILHFRIQSLDSILDTDSIPADGRGPEQIRIRPGVYQKTPEYQLAERDYYR